MSIRSLNRICSAIAAAALITAASLFDGGLAEDKTAQPNPGTVSSSPKARPLAPSDLEPLNTGDTTGVLGKSVAAPNGDNLGLITDVIVDRARQPRAAVIDFGGFLGVGSRKIAVDWNLLSFDPEKRDHPALLAFGRREIQAAPEYQDDTPSAEMVGPPLIGPSSGANADK